MNAFEQALERGDIELGEFAEPVTAYSVITLARAGDNMPWRMDVLFGAIAQVMDEPRWEHTEAGERIRERVLEEPTLRRWIEEQTNKVRPGDERIRGFVAGAIMACIEVMIRNEAAA